MYIIFEDDADNSDLKKINPRYIVVYEVPQSIVMTYFHTFSISNSAFNEPNSKKLRFVRLFEIFLIFKIVHIHKRLFHDILP